MFLVYVDPDQIPQKVFPSFFTTMAGGLLLLLLDNNFITLFIVAGMLLAVVACLRLKKLKTYEKKTMINLKSSSPYSSWSPCFWPLWPGSG